MGTYDDVLARGWDGQGDKKVQDSLKNRVRSKNTGHSQQYIGGRLDRGRKKSAGQ